MNGSKCKCPEVAIITSVLTVIGGLNWGLIGITELWGNRFNLIEWISLTLFANNILADVVYILIGLTAIHFMMMCQRKNK